MKSNILSTFYKNHSDAELANIYQLFEAAKDNGARCDVLIPCAEWIDKILIGSNLSLSDRLIIAEKCFFGEIAERYLAETENTAPKYKLEAYDKDHDIYTLILIHADIDFLKQLGLSLWNSFSLSAKINNEPIDWLIISTENDETPICYLDTTWKNY